jgi:radical SAM protein with 4Fe4S-binding SPASM domain
MTPFSRIREPRDLARILLGKPTRAEQEKRVRERDEERLARNEKRWAEARAQREQLLWEVRYWRALAGKPVFAEPIFAIDNIELTNRCPMRCIMCPRTEHMTRAQGYMSFAVFSRVIDEFVAVNPEAARTRGAFLHHFGESLMHPEVGRFIRYAEEHGVRVKLSVNPLAMKDRVIDSLIESPPSYLMIALDGHDDASFERIRGVRNAYDFSVERLHSYLARKVAAKVPTFVELGMIDFVENADSLHLLRDRWNGIEGIDSVTAKRFTAWDGSAEEINAYAPEPMTNEQARKHSPVPSCHLPWETVSITWDGAVVPCCYDYDRKMVLGNVMHQTLTEIWNGEPMRALRAEFRSNAVENPLCRQCPKLYRISKRTDPSEAKAPSEATDEISGRRLEAEACGAEVA